MNRLANTSLDLEHDWNMSLSSGEKTIVNLVRLMLHKPVLAILDEPLSHLSESMRAPLLRNALEALPEDASVLVINHELSEDITSLFNARYDLDVSGKVLIKN